LVDLHAIQFAKGNISFLKVTFAGKFLPFPAKKNFFRVEFGVALSVIGSINKKDGKQNELLLH